MGAKTRYRSSRRKFFFVSQRHNKLERIRLRHGFVPYSENCKLADEAKLDIKSDCMV